jgi:predicted amidohydrolase
MTHPENRGPELAFDSYVAVALQPRIYGCRNRDDVKKNLENQLRLLDYAIPHAFLVGGGPVKLVSLAEGSIQGFWDEISHMDQATYCKELAIRIPGEETDLLAKKAKEYGVYLVAQAKVVEPDIASDRFFNQGFIISPEGEIILKHTKNIISLVEGSTSPYDLWDKWSEKYGESLEAYYPVAKTEIGNLAVSICAETVLFPETYRAFTLMGAEVVVRMTLPEPMVMWGIWEATSRARAFDNACYLVCPNGGPYYMTPGDDAPYSLLGGHAMIIDYRGDVRCKADHQNESGVPGEIQIKALREYRASSPQAGELSQMRSSLWKQIYERWPDYPKNLYVDRTYSHVLERHGLHLKALEKLFEAGIFTRPAR